MIRHARGLSSVLFVLLVPLLAAPALLSASGPELAPDPEDPDAIAASLRAEAMTLLEDTGDFAATADFLVESAESIDVTTPARAVNLRLASRYFHHAGRLDEAYSTMMLAARAAYTAKAYSLAADALLDAGVIAAEDGEYGAAQRAGDKAGFVLRTADLPPEERFRILGRVVYTEAPVLESRLAVDPEEGGDEDGGDQDGGENH